MRVTTQNKGGGQGHAVTSTTLRSCFFSLLHGIVATDVNTDYYTSPFPVNPGPFRRCQAYLPHLLSHLTLRLTPGPVTISTSPPLPLVFRSPLLSRLHAARPSLPVSLTSLKPFFLLIELLRADWLTLHENQTYDSSDGADYRGSRKVTLGLLSSSLLPVWSALEKTVVACRAQTTKAEEVFKVPCRSVGYMMKERN